MQPQTETAIGAIRPHGAIRERRVTDGEIETWRPFRPRKVSGDNSRARLKQAGDARDRGIEFDAGDTRSLAQGLKPKMLTSLRAIMARIAETFPPETRLSRPAAGFLLWLELPRQVNALDLHSRARECGISVSPGQIFSSRSNLSNYLRLNCANDPTPRLLRAVTKLGEICAALAVEEGKPA